MSAKLSLPIYTRSVYDNSILESLGRCNRLGFYNYFLNRAASAKNYPIDFGVAYHKFREVLEILYVKTVVEGGKELEDVKDKIYVLAVQKALEGWEDPPLEHNKAYLDEGRLRRTFEECFPRWVREKAQGRYTVLMTETAFDLELPFDWVWCPECGFVDYDATENDPCPNCDGHILIKPRFGGRVDQLVEWNGRLWVRDFKTTSRMGKSYSLKFDPNHQITGYSWATQQLSGQDIEGAIIEVVYNTKKQGPEFFPFLSTRSQGHFEPWLEWVESEYLTLASNMRTGMWPMRTSSCDDYSGCFFREVCRQGSWKMIEGWLESNTVFSNWDYTNPDAEEGLTAD